MAKAKTIESFASRVTSALREKYAKIGANIGTARDIAEMAPPKRFVPTGIWHLDHILSQGSGVPCGRFIEVFAPESVGKSALCEFIMSCFKEVGGTLHHIDTEHTRDDSHLASYGITDEDYIDGSDLPDLEAVWDYIRDVVRLLKDSNAEREASNQPPEPPNLLILDSLAATPSRAELNEKSHDDSHVGLQARSNAKGVRTTIRAFSASDAVFLCINQIRDKIGATGYGPKTDTPGGRAMKFAYSIRLKLAKIETLKKGDTAIGHLIEVTTVKNKHAAPNQKCILHLSYTNGISVTRSNLYFLQKRKKVVAAGTKGYRLVGCDDIFKAKDFKAFVEAHPKEVAAAVQAAMAEEAENLPAKDDA